MKRRIGVIEAFGVALVVAFAALIGACGPSGPTPEQVKAAQVAAAQATANSPCPPDGKWAECSVAERLLQSGLGLRRDSLPAREKGITESGVLYHVGMANLELFVFSDSLARKAAVAKMDTTPFIGYNDDQTTRGERSLIQSANLLALLDSHRDEQRERIGNAITGGPPQPPTKR
ncbi:MAG TPA: hypothetical protein VIJ16_02500 [Gemmatimonadaceae bacterium]